MHISCYLLGRLHGIRPRNRDIPIYMTSDMLFRIYLQSFSRKAFPLFIFCYFDCITYKCKYPMCDACHGKFSAWKTNHAQCFAYMWRKSMPSQREDLFFFHILQYLRDTKVFPFVCHVGARILSSATLQCILLWYYKFSMFICI